MMHFTNPIEFPRNRAAEEYLLEGLWHMGCVESDLHTAPYSDKWPRGQMGPGEH